MPLCERCGAESPEGAQYCMSCGQAMPETPRVTAAAGPQPAPEELSIADHQLTEAFALSDQGRLTDAVKVAQQVLRLNPGSTTAHSLLGTLYERLGNRDAAIREYQAVLTLSPGSTADRQRLNELLGVPATPSEAPPLPVKVARRSEKQYVIGFAALFVILVVLILFAIRSRSNTGGEEALQPPPATSSTAVAGANQPGLPRTGGTPIAAQPAAPAVIPSFAPSVSMPLISPPSAPVVTAASEPEEQAEVPQPAETTRPIILPPPPGNTAAREDAFGVLPGGGVVLSRAPVIKTPPPARGQSIITGGIQPSAALARQQVVDGRLTEARQTYEAAIAAQASPPPKLREELATVYFRLGQRRDAARQYLSAYNTYRQQLDAGTEGIDAEAAAHGLSTCKAALRALGVRTP